MNQKANEPHDPNDPSISAVERSRRLRGVIATADRSILERLLYRFEVKLHAKFPRAAVDKDADDKPKDSPLKIAMLVVLGCVALYYVYQTFFA